MKAKIFYGQEDIPQPLHKAVLLLLWAAKLLKRDKPPRPQMVPKTLMSLISTFNETPLNEHFLGCRDHHFFGSQRP